MLQSVADRYSNHILQTSLTLTLFILLLHISVFPAFGQNTETLDTLMVLEESVVSSSRIPQTAESSGRNITIIPAKEIKQLPAHTIDEVLRYAPGVEVQSRGAFGTQSDFSIRGSTFSQVLVMIDGMRFNDPLTAHLNSAIPVASSAIKRIEVLHGPAAAQYGADAVGGVINIITKTFGHKEDTPHTDARLKAGYGQYNLKTGRAGLMHYGKNYRLSAGGMWLKSPGQSLGPDYKDRFNIGNASLSGGVQLGEGWDLTARSAYDSRDYNAKYFYTASPADQATEKVTSWWNQLRLAKASPHKTTTLEGSFKKSTDDYLFSPKATANHHITNLLNAQLYQNWSFAKHWTWSYGLQTTRRSIDSNDRGDHQDWHYAGFSVMEWHPIDVFTLTGSLRLDHDESYGTELMPQLSASFQAGTWTLRASGGRSIRAPRYTEQYISTNLQGPLAAGRNIGNPNLKAERAWSAEAGFDVNIMPSLQLSSTAFLRESSNLIDYVLTNASNIANNGNLKPAADYLYSSNLNRVQTAGVETEITFRKYLGSHWSFNSDIAYTFINLYDDENVNSKYISGYARHLINGHISLRRSPLELSLNGLWKQRQKDQANPISALKSSNYSVWNAKLSYHLSHGLTVSAEADNLFDKNYQDILGARMPGRWIMGLLSWHFTHR